MEFGIWFIIMVLLGIGYEASKLRSTLEGLRRDFSDGDVPAKIGNIGEELIEIRKELQGLDDVSDIGEQLQEIRKELQGLLECNSSEYGNSVGASSLWELKHLGIRMDEVRGSVDKVCDSVEAMQRGADTTGKLLESKLEDVRSEIAQANFRLEDD